MTVHGANLAGASEELGYLQCRFNGTVVRAELVGGEALVCNSTEGAAGVVSVEVTTNGRDFSASGVLYELVSVLVSEVSPWSGPELGGTVVTIAGSHLTHAAQYDALRCRFGGMVGSQAASAHGSDGVRCVSPRNACGA